MSVTRAKKALILEELTDKFKKTKAVVFTQYNGISVKDTSTIRRGLKKHNIDYKVAKKNLINLAAKQAGLEGVPEEFMIGQVAVIFGYDDEVMPAKTVYGFSKEFEALKIVGGMMAGALMNAKETIALAKIPSKLELLGQFAGMLKSPLNSFGGMLRGSGNSLARAFSAYAEKKNS